MMLPPVSNIPVPRHVVRACPQHVSSLTFGNTPGSVKSCPAMRDLPSAVREITALKFERLVGLVLEMRL